MKLRISVAIAMFFLYAHPATSVASAVQYKPVQCEQRDGVVSVRLEDPAYASHVTVMRPDGGVVDISSPAMRHDYRVQAASVSSLQISIKDQMGEQFAEDGLRHARHVFDDPGIYTILFWDGVTPHKSMADYTCKVNLAADGSVSLAAIKEAPIACGTGLQPAQACRPSDSCHYAGHGYCCSGASPCYCNDCCVALKSASR